MNLDRQTTTTQQISPNAREHARLVPAGSIAQVAAMEGIEGDRQRSLQQEVAEFDQRAVGPFAGGEQIQQAAHEIAVQLSSLGSNAQHLLKAASADSSHHAVDAKV